MDPKTTRREFCSTTISFVAVASLIEGCGGGGNPGGPSGGGNVPQLTRISGTTAGNSVTVTIDSASPLASTGSAAIVEAGGNSYLVSRTGQDTFSALTAICTHEQCIVTGFESGTYQCPCHGSQYSTGGSVVRGPATRNLRQFTTQFTNNVLTITV
jgi:nitrite reductase/ring-hydroxylating ferredoxin subunit